MFGIKAAVLVIVVEALLRIGRRALKTRLLIGVAGAAFVGIFFLALPFPLIVLAAGLVGGFIIESRAGAAAQPVPGRWRHAAISVAGGLALWWAPVAVAVLLLGSSHVLVDIGLFFSKLAVVSFGGAYALLAYMAQQAVESYHWMSAAEMVDGLGRTAAVRAAPAVPREDRPTGEPDVCPVGHAHVPGQPDHGRLLYLREW